MADGLRQHDLLVMPLPRAALMASRSIQARITVARPLPAQNKYTLCAMASAATWAKASRFPTDTR
jgi:hypothetical protein